MSSRALPPSTALDWSDAQSWARASSPGSNPAALLDGTMAAADLAVVVVTSWGANVLRHGLAAPTPAVMTTTLLAAVLLYNVLRSLGCYRRAATASPRIWVMRVLRGWSFVFASLVVVAYLMKISDDFSRMWATGWYAGALLGLLAVRTYGAARVRGWRRSGQLTRIIAVVDVDGRGPELARRLQHGSEGDMRLLGVFSPAPTDRPGQAIDDLIRLSRFFRIDDIVVSVSGTGGHALDALMTRLGTIPTNVLLNPDLPEMAVSPKEPALLFGQPVLTVSSRPLANWGRVIKRIEDLALSSVAIILIAPLMAAVALAIKCDSPGPVLFRQKRLGFNNNVITVYKFRTMHHQFTPDTTVTQATRNDKRVTRLGRLLRRTSIDELPQLLNVLQGTMSLVGPRPHALAHNDQYAKLIDNYLGRHRVQPGITGWAQVNGLRGETDTLDKMQRRVEHDLAYTDDWSLLLDVKILIATVFTTLFNRNAY